MGANAHYGNSASTTVHITVTNNEVSDICFFFFMYFIALLLKMALHLN